jgi:hypothetical protein
MVVFSGVNNRNHCPYCLWSCHLDLYSAGDRLSACKGQMMPIGLTMKKSRNKYRFESRGELMLIHECMDCKTLSINRIAADDDAESILDIYQNSLKYSSKHHDKCRQQGIEILGAGEMDLVYRQLYGYTLEFSIMG